jgi:DNA-binding response OmpR family regulator
MSGILLVSDDAELVRNLTGTLNDLGHDVHSVSVGKKAYRALWEVHPDLILIDAATNPSVLRSFCNELKQEQEAREIPLIALIPDDRVKRFDFWDLIEDFVLIPCRAEELELRIRQVQRKKSWGHSRDGISVGDVFIDFMGYEVRIQGVPVALT